jgi:hypothetical protein
MRSTLFLSVAHEPPENKRRNEIKKRKELRFMEKQN